MQSVVKLLPRKSFGIYGTVLLALFVLFAVIVLAVSASLTFDASFHCYDRTISKMKEPSLLKAINIKCSLEYQEKFRTNLIFGLLILNFVVVFALSIIYGYLVKHRVEKYDYPTRMATTNNEDDEDEVMMAPPNSGQDHRDVRGCLGHFSTFFIYIIHLIVARIIPLLIFAIIFYRSDIPDHFSCPWIVDLDTEQAITSNSNVTLHSSYNLTMIGCTNPVGGKSKSLFNVVASMDVVVVTLTFVELAYLAWLSFNDRNFITDQEFCSVYLLRKRKTIRKMVKKLKERFSADNQELFQLRDDFGDTEISLRNLKDIYVNVIIQEERENMNAYPVKFERHMIYGAHLETPKEVTKLTSTVQMFEPKGNYKTWRYPRTILVIGRPGIGKTMLTKIILQQWKENGNVFWHDKIVILLKFFTFGNRTLTFREMLAHGLNLSIYDFETVYRTILSIPTKTVLLFDGLDDLDVDSEVLRGNSESFSRSDKMPVFSIFKMLVEGRLLPGVTVLTTSRPTADNVFQLLSFERTVEILGFSEEQIQKYVFKFCERDIVNAELIWSHIKDSAELLSLCYIPLGSYIVCLTLKESIENYESNGIPKTVTELYKRAIKVLLFRHHPIYKLKPRLNDYLIDRFPKELVNDFSKLKEVAKCGLEKGRFIFERTTRDEFGGLANCGLFHKLPDKRRHYFCFLHLTLQEFLAASKVVDDMDNIDDFLTSHINDPKWHLVIQFVFGLVGDKIRDAKGELLKKWQRIYVEVQKRLKDWIFSLGNIAATYEKNIALLAIKCLYELQDSETMKSICSSFLAGGNGELCLKELNITPVDSAALFEFLGNSKNLKRLIFDDCRIQGNYSYNKMNKSLLCNPTNCITFLKLAGNFTSGGVEYLSDALKSENCKLTSLDLGYNEMTDQGAKYLSEALKSENCKLTSLDLSFNTTTDQGAEYLGDALKSENCKLTSLDLGNSEITDEGAKYLSKALKSGDCKLTSLDLGHSGITDQGAEYLSDALKSGNCKLTSLGLGNNGITDQGAEYLSDALKSGNCKLTSLILADNGVTGQGAKYLSGALTSENCELTLLNLAGNEIADQGVEYLCRASESKECKLASLNLADNGVTDEGVKYVGAAVKSENCKLISLNLAVNEITDQGAEYLRAALKSQNSKLSL